MNKNNNTIINKINNNDNYIDKKDVEEMKNILENFHNSENITSEELVDNNIPITRENNDISKTSLNVSTEDTLAMKKILEKMYESAEKISKDLSELSESDDYGKDLISVKGDTVNIGNKYEIKVRFSETLGSKKNFYDIYEINTGKCLCKDLFLFEAAEAIVRLLNKGENILGEKIRKVIFYEQKYVKNRQDAAIFKKRLNESKNNRKNFNIYEMKYHNSKEEALKAKKKIIEIINNL